MLSGGNGLNVGEAAGFALTLLQAVMIALIYVDEALRSPVVSCAPAASASLEIESNPSGEAVPERARQVWMQDCVSPSRRATSRVWAMGLWMLGGRWRIWGGAEKNDSEMSRFRWGWLN